MTGPGQDFPLQHNSHQSWILPGWSYLHPQQSTRNIVGLTVRWGNKRQAWRWETQIPPPIPSPRGTTQVPMSFALPEVGRGRGSPDQTRCPGGHWQGCDRAWGACGPLGAGGCSRGCGRSTRQAPFPSPGPALSPCGCVSAQSRSLRPPGQMCMSTAPHGLTQASSTLGTLPRCTLARWGTVRCRVRKDGETGQAGRQSEVPQSGTEGGPLRLRAPFALSLGLQEKPPEPQGSPCRTL